MNITRYGSLRSQGRQRRAVLKCRQDSKREAHACHAQTARRAKVAQPFLLRCRANQNEHPRVPHSPRGALRDRHGRWVRDAMDAACCETNSMMRTAKSCGPDAPGLALSRESDLSTTVTTKPGHRGEHV